MEPVSNANMGIAVAVILVLLGAVLPVLAIIDRFRTQKREVSFETEFATVQSVNEVRGEVKEVKGTVEALKREIIQNGEVRRQAIEGKVEAARIEAKLEAGALYEKVNALTKDLAANSTETRMINQNVQLLTAELRRNSREEARR